MPGGGGAFVVEVTPEHVTLDTNHPLAGQALTFDVDVLTITKVAPGSSGRDWESASRVQEKGSSRVPCCAVLCCAMLCVMHPAA